MAEHHFNLRALLGEKKEIYYTLILTHNGFCVVLEINNMLRARNQ